MYMIYIIWNFKKYIYRFIGDENLGYCVRVRSNLANIRQNAVVVILLE